MLQDHSRNIQHYIHNSTVFSFMLNDIFSVAAYFQFVVLFAAYFRFNKHLPTKNFYLLKKLYKKMEPSSSRTYTVETRLVCS